MKGQFQIKFIFTHESHGQNFIYKDDGQKFLIAYIVQYILDPIKHTFIPIV